MIKKNINEGKILINFGFNQTLADKVVPRRDR